MKRSLRRATVDGALAGLVAGAVVALWYLAVDLAAGQALETPARLAAVWLDGDYRGVEAVPVLAFSAIHFGAFLALGAMAGGFLAATDVNAGPLVGMVLGLGMMTSIYYTGLWFAGVEDLEVLPGAHVLGSNLAAGLAWAGIVGWLERGERPFGFEIFGAPRLVRSVTTGLVGAAAVALWFLVLDVLRGQPFFTPAALGAALLGEAATAAAVEVTPGVVTFYTVIHLALFVVAGAAFVGVAERLERAPGFWYLAVMAFIVLDAVFLPAMALMGMWLMGSLALWAVAVANLLAVASMAWWILRDRPELRRALFRQLAADREAQGAPPG